MRGRSRLWGGCTCRKKIHGCVKCTDGWMDGGRGKERGSGFPAENVFC